MGKYRSFNEVEESYFRDHPEEMDNYLKLIFAEYDQDGNIGALLSSLRVLSRVKGVSRIAQETGLSRKGIQKALSEDGNPNFSSITAIMHAMGYRLSPQRLNHS